MALTTVQLITQLYVGYYNRAPDPEGLNYWVGRVNAGVSLADIADSFAASPEAVATYPFLALPNVASAEGFLTQVYANLFGRPIDDDGKAYYSNLLATGQTTPGQIIAQIQANANTNTTPGNTDAAFLANKVAVGEYWVNEAINTPNFQFNDAAKSSASSVLVGVTNNAATVDAAKAAADNFFDTPNVPAVAFTDGIDNIVGTANNDLFTATQATLQATDSLDGGAGRDVLNYTATGAGHTIAAATVTNVEVINVRNLSTTGAGTAEVATFTFSDVTVPGVAVGGDPANTATITIGGRTVTLTGGTAVAPAGDVVFTAAQIAQAFSGATVAGASSSDAIGAPIGGYNVTGTTSNSVTFTATTNGDQTGVNDLSSGVATTGAAAAPTYTITNGTTTGTSSDVTVNAANFAGATEFNSVNSAADVIVNGVSATQAVGLNGGTGNLSFTSTGTAGTINLTGVNSQSVSTASALTTATVNSNGTANTATLGFGGPLTTLNVNATSNLTASLTAGNFVTTNAVISGIATSVVLNGASGFKSLDASGLTVGGVTASVSTVTESVKGGAGADVVTIVGGLKAGATVNLGAGNDRLVGTTALAATVGDIDGGEGRDSVSSTLINAGNGGKFKNFEILELGGNTLDVALLTGTTIDTLSLAGAAAGGGTFNNVANTVKLEVSSTSAAGTTTVNVAGAAANTADVFNIGFVGKAAAGATEAAPTNIAAGILTVANVETFNIASGGTGFVANSATLTGNSGLQTLTVTGDKALSLSFGAGNGTAANSAADAVNGVKLIDASAATGAITINTANISNIANAGLTVNTGSGKDKITLDTAKATVNAGAGDDMITVNADSAGSTLTGGGGNDTFDVHGAVFGGGSIEGATSTVTTITDFTAGDKLVVATGGTGVALGAAKDVSAAQTLEDAFNIANGGAATTGVSWFVYANNTYVVDDINASDTVQSTDILVKLVGTLDLSTAIHSATGEIAWA